MAVKRGHETRYVRRLKTADTQQDTVYWTMEEIKIF
jgi:hypothetical protein